MGILKRFNSLRQSSWTTWQVKHVAPAVERSEALSCFAAAMPDAAVLVTSLRGLALRDARERPLRIRLARHYLWRGRSVGTLL